MLISTDEKLRRAKQPTVERLHELAEGTSSHVKNLLKVIARRFCDADALAYKIRREAKATEWHTQLFKRELGITMGDLIQQCRKDTSSILMRDTSLSMEKVAQLVGFETYDGFRRCHKAQTGLTPLKMKEYLRKVPRAQQPLVDDFLSWYFWVRHYRDELTVAHCSAGLAFLRGHSDPK